ncbi:MAG TPA: septum formation initiator family protein [Candidatus Kapabacteria bacterium]|jgi:cell division protein FtsL|nr:septum formation initiator family protein [Ignavibacteria bacterium]HRE56478.1 septum formation initiator family protein [Candidatus Kapabacteria bacterium]HRI30703.1 septum formation initiator family protein [Candidatus Kapabacteria bacterium]
MTSNKKEATAIVQTRRLVNRWSVFGLLGMSAIFMVLYVSNVISVNTLLRRIPKLEEKHDSLLYQSRRLEESIARLQSAERITIIAKEKLGMVPNQNAPQVLH